MAEDEFHPPGPMPVKLGALPLDLTERVSVTVTCWRLVIVVWPTRVVVSSGLEMETIPGAVWMVLTGSTVIVTGCVSYTKDSEETGV